MSQEKRSIFCEVIVFVILSKNMYRCPVPNGFRDIAISQYSTVQMGYVDIPQKNEKMKWACISIDDSYGQSTSKPKGNSSTKKRNKSTGYSEEDQHSQ
jgi:hypothetical protein